MRLGTMFALGGGRVRFENPRMGSDPHPAMKNLYCGRRSPHLHSFMHQLIGNAIEPAIDRDVIIDVDLSLGPDREIKALAGQWSHSRAIHGEKQAVAETFTLFEGVMIEFLQELSDGSIQFAEGEKLAMTECS